MERLEELRKKQIAVGLTGEEHEEWLALEAKEPKKVKKGK